MSEPTTLRAGDSASWTRSLPDYLPSAGWSLKYRLLWSAGTAVDITATPAGDDFEVTLTAATTATWAAGQATLVSWVEKTPERVTLGQQPLTILPDLAEATTFDGRSQNRRGLDDARTALAAYLAAGQLHVMEYEVAGRSMKFRSTEDILALIRYYEGEVAKEDVALALLNGGSAGRVYTRF